jgi:hypothetical protein
VARRWQRASELNTAVLDALKRHEGDVLLCLPAYTAEGPRYNVYILPPAELYSVGQSEHFLDRADPTRRIYIEVGSIDPNAIPINVEVTALGNSPGEKSAPGIEASTRTEAEAGSVAMDEVTRFAAGPRALHASERS